MGNLLEDTRHLGLRFGLTALRAQQASEIRTLPAGLFNEKDQRDIPQSRSDLLGLARGGHAVGKPHAIEVLSEGLSVF